MRSLAKHAGRIAVYGALAAIVFYLEPAVRCVYNPADLRDIARACTETADILLLPPDMRRYALETAAQSNQEMGRMPEALAIVSRLVAQDAVRTQLLTNVYLEEGKIAYDSHRLDDAIENFTQALESESIRPTALAWRARAHTARGDYAAALGDYTEALRTNPNEAEVHEARARVFLKLNQPVAATGDLTASLAMDSENPWALALRAGARLDLKDYEGAIADADASISISPPLEDPYLYKAIALRELGRFDDALGALTTWERAIGRSTAPAHRNRALIYERTGERALAEEAYSAAITLEPAFAPAYTARGLLRWQSLNDTDGALADFERAVSLGDADARELHRKALAARGALAR